jgi:sulfide dehydrogenase [flavocytochrome c] flavoprotein subunit
MLLYALWQDALYGTPITNVGCSAPVAQTKINWAGKTWRYDSGTNSMVVSASNAATEPSEVHLEPMLK